MPEDEEIVDELEEEPGYYPVEDEFEEEPEEGDGDGDGEPEVTEEEPVAESEPEIPYIPYVAPAGESADAALLRDGMTPELYDAMRREMAAEISRHMQAMQTANIHVTTAAAEHPELFRQYGARIQATLAELPPETRVKPEAVHIAIARIVMEEADRGGLGKTLRRLADLAEGGGESRPVRAPKAPIPAAQRPPSPSSRGASAPAPSRGGTDAKVEILVKDGISRSVACAMVASGEV